MAGDVVYSSVANGDDVHGTLFNGTKFWLSQKVPSRTRFVEDIRANGGTVVQLEKQANIKLVDHARKEALPGTHSYKYIELSVRHGVLENLEDHIVGPPEGTVRSIGSVVRPAKTTRNKYTQEDERILWDWVQTNPQKFGGTDGNEIYKQLETIHPQHTWQSWRDHWIKHMKGRPKPVYPANNAPPTPPADAQISGALAEAEQPASDQVTPADEDFDSFTEDDAQELMDFGDNILGIDPEQVSLAWRQWAQHSDSVHRPERWRSFWDTRVLLRYLKKRKKKVYQLNRAEASRSKSSQQMTSDEQRKALKATSIEQSTQDMQNAERVADSKGENSQPNPTNPQELVSEPKVPDQSPREAEQIKSPIGNSFLKRKRSAIEDDLPSSSPPDPTLTTPQRKKAASSLPREIAPTPEGSPTQSLGSNYSPLFLTNESESDDQRSTSSANGLEDLGREPSESLSEPDRTLTGDRTRYRAVTPDVDVEVATPKADEDVEADHDADERAREDGPEDASQSRRDTASPKPREYSSSSVDTEAYFADSTLSPDLEVPDPPGGWDEVLRPSSPAAPSEAHSHDHHPTSSHLPASDDLIPPNSAPAEDDTAGTTSATSPTDFDTRLANWISLRVFEGFSASVVEEVLDRTCMSTDLALRALRHMKKRAKAETEKETETSRGEVDVVGLDMLPRDWKGVWTEQDDADLQDMDTRRVARVEDKHGAGGLRARWDFLAFMNE